MFSMHGPIGTTCAAGFGGNDCCQGKCFDDHQFWVRKNYCNAKRKTVIIKESLKIVPKCK